MSEDLRYRLVVLAEGYRPLLTEYLDPREAVEIALQARRVDDLSCTVRGFIVTPEGKGIEHALIEPLGFRDGDRSVAGSPLATDPLAVTDERGAFALCISRVVAVLIAKVHARGYAPRILDLVNDGAPRSWTLTEGATVHGTLRRHGRPAVGAVVGVVPVFRDSLGFSDSTEIATNGDGEFSIPNLPPGREYRLYARMDSLPAGGGLSTRPLLVPEGEPIVDLGPMVLEDSWTLRGRVVTEDGGAATAGVTLGVQREETDDFLMADVFPDGSFEARGLPKEELILLVDVEGFRLSPLNDKLEAKASTPFLRIRPRDRGRLLNVLLEPDPRSSRAVPRAEDIPLPLP